MKLFDELLRHPMTTTAGGMTTAATGIISKIFEHSDFVNNLFAHGCMAIGAAGTLVGIWAHAKSWRARGRIEELDIAIKEAQLHKLQVGNHDA